MPLTITITRYTAPIDDTWFDYINMDKDVTVHEFADDSESTTVDQAIDLLTDENWEPSTWPIDSFHSHDWLAARYPHFDDPDTEDVGGRAILGRLAPQ